MLRVILYRSSTNQTLVCFRGMYVWLKGRVEGADSWERY